MSFAHTLLKKVNETEMDVTYAVLSPDFNDAHRWEEVAEIVVSKTASTHVFSPRNAWLGEKVVPPYVYGLDEAERERILSTEFSGYCYGAWTGRILSLIRRMQATGEFPQSARGVV